MVEYLSGGRIQGSSTLTQANHTSWKEIARGTGNGGTTIDSGTFTAKDNLMILGHITQGRVYLTYNGSTGNEYAHRRSEEGGADSTQTSQNKLDMSRNLGEDVFFVGDTINVTNKEKLGFYNACSQNSAGAGNAPKRQEWVTKYVPSSLSTNITSVKITTDSGTYDSNDQFVVLGCDNDEADSGTPFWQEIKDVTLSSSSDTLDSGTITAKKYLFVTWKTDPTGGNTDDIKVRFNNDSGSNYAYRRDAGASDETFTSTNNPRIDAANGAYARDGFMYIINKSDKEKLIYAQDCISQGTGGGQAPRYIETAMKWANTSAQITRIELINQGSGDIASGSHMRIFGAD